MTTHKQVPNSPGQLVWCPGDPSLGVGVVMGRDGPIIRVRFLRLTEERNYSTRSAENAILRYQIAHGERVQDQTGREVRIRGHLAETPENLAVYELEDGTTMVENELTPNVRDIGAKERLATLTLAHPEVVRARMQGLELGNFGKRPGYAAILGSRVQWLPHQVDVATRAIERDPVRLLLADEVGLGKTVEAALIYAGLRREGRADRVLILTPDALCIQWLGEIYRKAHELLVLLDTQRIDDAAQDFPDMSPFEAHQRMVASIDRLVADPMLAEQASSSTWDLVIVDEAHHLRWRPDDGGHPSYRLVEALARNSRHLLLLTATPMALDPTEYHALLRLLDPARFDDPATFETVATRAATIRDLARHLAQAVDERTPIDKALEKAAAAALGDDAADHEALSALIAAKADAPNRFALSESVLAALRDRHGLTDYVVRNRRGPVGGLPQRQAQTFALEPPAPQELLLEVGESVMFDLAQTLTDPAESRRAIGELLRALWATPRALHDILRPYSAQLAKELAPHIEEVTGAPLDVNGLPTGDARLRWLVQTARALEDGNKLLVFVESAVAVRALKDALEPVFGGDIALFHRELAPRDQDRQVAYFRDPEGPRLMLSTEAGGEGRNFQFCHKVVLYDLPWRPATVEQRIGRVDRVGQTRDVHVLVPYFKSGYEAAIVKIMQQSIGVLDRTVGGIDHALEYVSDRLADLVLGSAGAEAWKDLYRDTETMVRQARQRIEDDVDPILDHASFSPERAQAILAQVPADLEARTETFVQRYAGHSKLEVHSKGKHRVAIEGAPGAAGREDTATGYMGTFSRTFALDHEDTEFLSFGHPLVEQALEWAREAHEASAALAVSRGFATDGAIFLWSYGLDLPDDAPEAMIYFETPFLTFALDEAGLRVPTFETLLKTNERPLDRMDLAPLRGSMDRWRKLVDGNYAAVETLADAAITTAGHQAARRLSVDFADRRRHLERSQARELAELKPKAKARKELLERHAAATAALDADLTRLTQAIGYARPRLLTALAVRLMRTKQVSA